jgi:hypothetical protein
MNPRRIYLVHAAASRLLRLGARARRPCPGGQRRSLGGEEEDAHHAENMAKAAGWLGEVQVLEEAFGSLL